MRNAKKLTALLLAATTMAAIFAGCGKTEDPQQNPQNTESQAPATETPDTEAPATETPETETPATETPADENQGSDAEQTGEDALAILTAVWAAVDEDKKFPVAGGDYDNSNMDGAGVFDPTNAEAMDSMLAVPADASAYVDNAASLMHMMNANTFTCGAFHIADAANTEAFVNAVNDSIANRQWMCGFPDKMFIATIGDAYVVSAFGKNEAMDTFKEKLVELYPDTQFVKEANIE